MAPIGGHYSTVGYGSPPMHHHGHQMGSLPFRNSRAGPPAPFTPSGPISMTRSASYQQPPQHAHGRRESATDFVTPSYRAPVSTYAPAPSFGRPQQLPSMGIASDSAHRTPGPYDVPEGHITPARRHSVYESHEY
jgi:hypothetical protein